GRAGEKLARSATADSCFGFTLRPLGGQDRPGAQPGQAVRLSLRLTTRVGVSVLRGAPWLRFVWSCREHPDPAGRRRVKRSAYLHPKGARGQQHAEEAT